MLPKTRKRAVPLMAFLNMARQYVDAANELYIVAHARPKIHGHVQLSSPLYFLYSHAAESALKAFLLAKNNSTRGHNIRSLYEKCRSLGLVVGPRDRFEIGKIATLLESGNKRQGFRYFSMESTSQPELSWVREVITDLIRAVGLHVRDDKPPRLGKQILVVGKPGPAIKALERQ